MARTSVKCVLFDLYGTLMDVRVDQDSPRVWAGLARALRSHGTPIQPARLKQLFVSTLNDERSRHADGFVMDVVLQRMLSSIDSKENPLDFGSLFRKLSIKKLTLRPYVLPLLRTLSGSGCKTGIISNTEAILTSFDLSRFPVLRSMDTIILSSNVGIKKPDPAIFALALKQLGISASSAVFIGDHLKDDIVGARNVGLKTVYLTNNEYEGTADRLAADYVLAANPTLREIMLALEKLGWKTIA